MSNYCFGCGSNSGDNTICYNGRVGYWCFSCDTRGHLPISDSAVSQRGQWYKVLRCPNCGESQEYTGSLKEASGIGSGNYTYMAKEAFGWDSSISMLDDDYEIKRQTKIIDEIRSEFPNISNSDLVELMDLRIDIFDIKSYKSLSPSDKKIIDQKNKIQREKNERFGVNSIPDI